MKPRKHLADLELEGYGESEDYRTIRIKFGPVTVWFSYVTPVAFQVTGLPIVVHENQWSKTTGKHLNTIDGGDRAAKKERVKAARFDQLWDEQVSPLLLKSFMAAQLLMNSDDYLPLAARRRSVDRGALQADYS